MFDCPLACHTSPTTTSLNTRSVSPDFTTSSRPLSARRHRPELDLPFPVPPDLRLHPRPTKTHPNRLPPPHQLPRSPPPHPSATPCGRQTPRSPRNPGCPQHNPTHNFSQKPDNQHASIHMKANTPLPHLFSSQNPQNHTLPPSATTASPSPSAGTTPPIATSSSPTPKPTSPASSPPPNRHRIRPDRTPRHPPTRLLPPDHRRPLPLENLRHHATPTRRPDAPTPQSPQRSPDLLPPSKLPHAPRPNHPPALQQTQQPKTRD